MTTVVDLGCYAAFGAFVLFEIKEESRDLFSSVDKEHPNSEAFGDGCGKYVYWNKYAPGDTLQTLIKKTKKLGSYQSDLPNWRRNLVLSVLTTIIIMIVFHKKLLSFPQFFLYVLVIFTIFYYSFNFYFHHYERYAVGNLNYNLDVLEKKFKRRNIITKKNESKNTKNHSPSLV